MKQKPKLAAYNIDWFNSTSTKNKCLKHTSDKNLPVTQEGQLTFLLDKYQTSKIKTTFVDAIGKVGTAARKAFYPLPHLKDKLICSFLELIYDGKSIMIDNSKDSFRQVYLSLNSKIENTLVKFFSCQYIPNWNCLLFNGVLSW
jgi:hypothetical protein